MINKNGARRKRSETSLIEPGVRIQKPPGELLTAEEKKVSLISYYYLFFLFLSYMIRQTILHLRKSGEKLSEKGLKRSPVWYQTWTKTKGKAKQ